MLDAYLISNPRRKMYKFLYQVNDDDEEIAQAVESATSWLLQHGNTVRRQKVKYILSMGMCEVHTWLM